MSDAPIVALIGAVEAVILLIVGGYLSGKLRRVDKRSQDTNAKASQVLEQVQNGHTSNLREESDVRHDENAGKLDTILEHLGRIDRSVGKLWQRSRHQEDQIDELTHPRSFMPPSGRHRGDTP